MRARARRATPDQDAYPADTTAILLNLIKAYDKAQRPVPVAFRELTSWMRSGERATHYLHSYPAKLLPQIAHFFLAAKNWIQPDEIILDPFSGTGTVAVETALSGREAYYADVNPLARLITSAKLTFVDPREATEHLQLISARYNEITAADPPWIRNIDLWYSPAAQRDLARLMRAIEDTCSGRLADFIRVTFSSTARKCSQADDRFAVPVRRKPTPSTTRSSERDVWNTFVTQFHANLQRSQQFEDLCKTNVRASCVGVDARHLLSPNTSPGTAAKPLPAHCVDTIITSPPYAGAQKYIRASSLNLGWLGLTGKDTLVELESQTIGREHFRKSQLDHIPTTGIPSADEFIRQIAESNRTRAIICATYLKDMAEAVAEMARVLKPRGKAIIIIGNNTVCGRTFESSRYLTDYFMQHHFQLRLELNDQIRSRTLLTNRSGGASAISHETILVFSR